ncbi:MAG TPA: hypothetical protein VF552_16825 [Allosphingosinicella sp.]
MSRPLDLPAYTAADVKAELLAAGTSGTIYSLVMPESEAALARVMDGGERGALLAVGGAALLEARRAESLFSRYREPWTQKQDGAHELYFERWLDWAAPAVAISAGDFPHRYPTAGASEGIFKLTAEYASRERAAGRVPSLHIFEGEYEGFPAFAAALQIEVVRHDRTRWEEAPAAVAANGLFWISQPSAIDGAVWPHFEAFAAALAEARPEAMLIPDLTYVGSVARPYRIALNAPNIPAVAISHSKPFGGYYHRVGGVLARREHPSLFGNKWFKNLLSLAWGAEMMERHGVFDLPTKYRPVQAAAAALVAERLGIAAFAPADVLLLGTAPEASASTPLLRSVLRGSGSERVVRLCLTPLMSALIDPALAPSVSVAP